MVTLLKSAFRKYCNYINKYYTVLPNGMLVAKTLCDEEKSN